MSSPVAELLGDLAAALDSLSARWYLFGAQAAILHGAPRLTADVDVTLLLERCPLDEAVKSLEAAGFQSRVPDVLRFATDTGVIPLDHPRSGMPVDVVIGGSGLEAEFAARAVRRNVEGVSVPVAACEDLIAMKILAGRPKDLDDALAVLSAQTGRMNLEMMRSTLQALEGALHRRDLIPVLEELLRTIR